MAGVAAAIIPAIISAIGSVVSSAAVGGRRQYNWSSRLMQDQYNLNEEAAQKNQERAKELYDYEFKNQSAFAEEQNRYNSPSAQMGRALNAGISKAAISGGTPAQPAAPAQGSSAGAGSASGVSIPGLDFGAPAGMMQGVSALARTFSDMKLANADAKLKETQSDLVSKQTVTEVARSSYMEALEELTLSQSNSESFRGSKLALETGVLKEISQNLVTQSDLTSDLMIAKLSQAKEALSRQRESNRLYRKYEEPRIQKQLDQLSASIALTYAQESEVFSKMGLNEAQAGLVSQLWMNAVKQGNRLDIENSFIPLEKKQAILSSQAGVLKTTSDIQRDWESLRLYINELQSKTAALGVSTGAQVVNAFTSLLKAGMMFSPTTHQGTEVSTDYAGHTYSRTFNHKYSK